VLGLPARFKVLTTSGGVATHQHIIQDAHHHLSLRAASASHALQPTNKFDALSDRKHTKPENTRVQPPRGVPTFQPREYRACSQRQGCDGDAASKTTNRGAYRCTSVHLAKNLATRGAPRYVQVIWGRGAGITSVIGVPHELARARSRLATPGKLAKFLSETCGQKVRTNCTGKAEEISFLRHIQPAFGLKILT
jgi:hypothetical protein